MLDPLRLNRKDGLFILGCLIVLVGGILIGLKYFQKAFPEASIDFRYDRAQTGVMAKTFLAEQGLTPPVDYRQVGRFGYDNYAKTYLEKELGVDSARAFLGHPVRLWYWQHRWFRPSTKEEFRVSITPGGEIVRLAHEVEEAAAGADLPEDSARRTAERFLLGVMKMDSAKLVFIDAVRLGRPARSDWNFTWKAKGIEPVKGSDYRYEVGLVGDHIGNYREFLHVPESWHASFSRLRSFNEIAGYFATVGFLLTLLAMIVVLFTRIRLRDIRWRIAIIFGGVACALTLLNQLNDLPLVLYGYDTTASWSGFITRSIFDALYATLGAGLFVFFITAAAETVYRQRYPEQLSLPRMFTVRALRTKTAFKSFLLGITLTSFFFAYQIAFYLIAGHYGAWSPSDVPYDNLLNTAMPWLAVLAIGFFPAVQEEFISRMFSIPFLQKLFRNRWTVLAVVIPAFLWGFGHSTYPNEPFWIRGVEVGLAGILVGWIMLRWGILATLVWHYTVDALYTAFLLFRSDNLYFVLTAAVAAGLLALPLLLALIAYVRKGRFLPEQGVLNADLPTAVTTPTESFSPAIMEPAPDTRAESGYRSLPRRRTVAAVALLAVGIGAALLPVARVGDFLSYPVSKTEAQHTFTDSLKATGWANPDTLRVTVFAGETDPIDADEALVYLLKHSGSVDGFNRLAAGQLNIGRWRVQAWKPEDRLRFIGSVNAHTGRIEALVPWLPEERPGDSLSEDSARTLAQRFLVWQGEDTATLEVKNHSLNTRPHRRDHGFTFEAKAGDPRHIAEAKYRRSVSVEGGMLSGSHTPWYKIPEEWQRARQATTTLRSVRQSVPFLLMATFVVWAMALLVQRTRRGLVPWKKSFLWALLPAGLTVIGGLNQFYLAQANYLSEIETPWAVFRMTTLLTWVIQCGMAYLLWVVGLALLNSLYGSKTWELRQPNRRGAFADALVAAAGGIGLLLLARAGSAWLRAWRPDWITFTGWGIPEWLAAPSSLTMMLASAVNRTLSIMLLLAFFACLWCGTLKKPLWRGLLILAVALMLLPMGAVDPGEWLLATLANLVLIAAAYLALRLFVAGRAVLLVTLSAAVATLQIALEGFGLGNGGLTAQTWIFVVVLAAGTVLWLRLPARNATES